MASSNLATYITRKTPLSSLIRISLAPAPTSSNGFQPAGSSPTWTFPNWKPASFRASFGNASRSSGAEPTQRICFSSSIGPGCINFYTHVQEPVKTPGERGSAGCGWHGLRRTPELESRIPGSPSWTVAPHTGHVSNVCGVKPGPLEPVIRFQINGIHLKSVWLSTLGAQSGHVSNSPGEPKLTPGWRVVRMELVNTT